MSKARSVIHSNPDILSGTPVFVGTRVPAQTLLDYLEADRDLSEFLEDFPTVTKVHALLALKEIARSKSERSLEQVISDLSREAQGRGLTPEILEEILKK